MNTSPGSRRAGTTNLAGTHTTAARHGPDGDEGRGAIMKAPIKSRKERDAGPPRSPRPSRGPRVGNGKMGAGTRGGDPPLARGGWKNTLLVGLLHHQLKGCEPWSTHEAPPTHTHTLAVVSRGERASHGHVFRGG